MSLSFLKAQSLCLALSFALAADAPAALTPEQQAEAQALIAQFTAAEFAVRQQAVEKLIAMGPDVVPLVRKALDETKDAEAKLRGEMVLRGIAERFGVRIDEVARRWKMNAGPSRVTLHVKDRPLAEVLRLLAEQTGNRPPGVSEDDGRRALSLDLDGATWWEAIDRIAASCELRLERAPAVDEPRLRLIPRVGPDVGTCSGPVTLRVRPLTCTTRTTFFFGANDKDPRAGTVTLHGCRLLTSWETRLPVVGWEIELTRVTLGSGAAFTPKRARAAAAAGVTISPWTHRQDLLRGVQELELDDVPAGTATLAALEGVVRLTLGADAEERRMEDILADRGQSAAGDGVSLTRAGAAREGGTLTVTLGVRFVEERAHARAIFMRDSTLGLFLATEKGGRRRPDGLDWKCTPKPGARAGRNEVDPRSGTLTLTFADAPEDAVRPAIIYVYPGDVEVQEFRFAMKDAPTQ